jgi:hypothetical protein
MVGGWKDNIKIDQKETHVECDDIGWILLAKDRA